MKMPNVFIVGAPKCGTTSLFHYLSQHSDVHLPPRKEPHYLAQDLRWNHGWGIESEKNYEALYDKSKKINIDASTWYLYSDSARKTISEDYPDSKVIICLRHPVNFMESMWWHMRSRGRDTSVNLMKALEKEMEIRNGLSFKPAPFRKSVLYREVACFSLYVNKYIEELGHSRIKIVLLEDLSKNLETVLSDLSIFLGIPWQPPRDSSVKNMAAPAEHLWFRILANKYKQFGDFIYSKRLEKVRFRVKKICEFANPNSEIERVRLTDEDWNRLREEMKHEISQLSVVINRDLSHWQQRFNRII